MQRIVLLFGTAVQPGWWGIGRGSHFTHAGKEFEREPGEERMVNQRAFEAFARIGLGIVPWVATRQADVIRHPINPIGGSGSAAIQVYFLLIVLTVAELALDLFAWLRIDRELREQAPRVKHGG